jgi:hypothetical protein
MRWIALTLLVLFSSTPAPSAMASAAAPATSPTTSPTRYAERHVTIVWSGLPADSRMRVILRTKSPRTVAEVAAQVLGPAAGIDASKIGTFDLVERDGATEMRIQISLVAQQPPLMKAREVADAMVERLRDLLRAEAQGALVHQLDAQRQLRDVAQARQEEADHDIEALRKRLREATGRVDVTPADVRKELSSLEEQRQAATLALEQGQVRAHALAESIAKLSAEAENRAKDDPVAAELEKVVQVKEAVIKRKREMHKQGAVSDSEVSEAEGDVPMARARLLERRQQVAASIAGDTLGGWNRELLSLGIERAELASRVKLLSSRLERLAAVANNLDRFDSLTRQRERARDELERAEHDVRAIEQHITSMVLPEAFVDSATEQAPEPQPR